MSETSSRPQPLAQQPIAVLYNLPPSTDAATTISAAADADVVEVAGKVQVALAARGIEAVLVPMPATATDPGEVAAEMARAGFRRVFNLAEAVAGDAAREHEVPDALAAHGLAHTGSPGRALWLAFRKDLAARTLAAAGVPVPRATLLDGPDDPLPNDIWPLFVKPARADGSIGIDQDSVVHDPGALRRRLAWLAANLPGPFLAEPYLPGPEINVAVMPGRRGLALVATTINFSPLPPDLWPIVTYAGKWDAASPEYASASVPAAGRLPGPLVRQALEVGRRAFRALGMRGYGRIDMRVDAHGAVAVIDANPNPDLHPNAGLSVAARHRGISYDVLVSRIAARAQPLGSKARGSSQVVGPEPAERRISDAAQGARS